jgi:2-polyprenyl-6-methoxyphenol hydroxylase-like FAD-dependent oxidoreductase
MEAMSELGLLDEFLKRPHNEFSELAGQIEQTGIRIADFRHLPTKAKFVAVMPQWEFLNFLAEVGEKLPNFKLMMRAEATDIIVENGQVCGVLTTTSTGPLEIRADLVIAADGRSSALRALAGLRVRDLGAPIDVLWMRLPRLSNDRIVPLGRIGAGYVFVMIERGDYFQCAFVVRKGGYDAVKAKGLQAFRDRIRAIAPFLGDRVETLRDWEDVKLLTVTVDRLEQWWRPGLLCIGDAAHAMSPIGGIGINLAVQDAVAAANILNGPLRRGAVTDADLARVQKRRLWPVSMIQTLQLTIQDRVLSPALNMDRPIRLPLAIKLLDRFAWLRRWPARVVGMGFRMEHVRIADQYPPGR